MTNTIFNRDGKRIANFSELKNGKVSVTIRSTELKSWLTGYDWKDHVYKKHGKCRNYFTATVPADKFSPMEIVTCANSCGRLSDNWVTE